MVSPRAHPPANRETDQRGIRCHQGKGRNHSPDPVGGQHSPSHSAMAFLRRWTEDLRSAQEKDEIHRRRWAPMAGAEGGQPTDGHPPEPLRQDLAPRSPGNGGSRTGIAGSSMAIASPSEGPISSLERVKRAAFMQHLLGHLSGGAGDLEKVGPAGGLYGRSRGQGRDGRFSRRDPGAGEPGGMVGVVVNEAQAGGRWDWVSGDCGHRRPRYLARRAVWPACGTVGQAWRAGAPSPGARRAIGSTLHGRVR